MAGWCDGAVGVDLIKMLSFDSINSYLMKPTTSSLKSRPSVISLVLSFFTLAMSYHYLLSYSWFKRIFKFHGMNDLSLLTFEDITFTFVGINYDIILLPVAFFIPLYLLSLFIRKDHWLQFIFEQLKKQNEDGKVIANEIRKTVSTI